MGHVLIRRAQWLGLVLSASLIWIGGAVACSSLIGADEYHVADKPAGTGGDGGSGGTGGTDARGAGETLCSATCASGLSCLHTRYGESGLCTTPCSDATECAPQHSCIGSSQAADDFPNSCLKDCATGPCPAGLVCLHLNDGSATCFPRDWALGIGDPCSSAGDCASGVCEGAPSGWCSRPCTTGDACAGDYEDNTNSEGEHNECVQVKGNNICVPGCELDPTCASFAQASCKRAVSGVAVCLP